jgi:hypothetical protein
MLQGNISTIKTVFAVKQYNHDLSTAWIISLYSCGEPEKNQGSQNSQTDRPIL